ncbi:GNAT family N-acetyltransferase [Aquimarina sp. RZ0]|uniref:GNAT family N-acetyltransferase n=1 Tax=Aquimarina sp. RZ0 TaxID=2607730 RepID=UPI0011F3AB0E|nr:GNAT family N-acetyltransferase [Aquimarina sp. RZ0]KAA1242453.1 GNAT family N-acetyltransferase [Aquimarina sp. RZ0]
MQIKKLNQIDFSILMECFLKAFENYFVKMPTGHNYYKERWQMAGVRLDLSYGMFDNNKLTSFIINAIGKRNGNLVAFNTGAGVLPEYRGKRIVNSIYQFAIPDLQKNGISECRLEVIKDNIRAIKVYKSIGFSITKHYKCYGGDITLKTRISDYKLKKVDSHYFEWNTLQQNTYSWDNHYTTVTKGNYEYYVVLVDGEADSYFIINPENGYLAQFNILGNTSSSWIRLFTSIKSVSGTIKINNVDKKLTEKNNALEEVGIKNTIDQYEMELFCEATL